jgi:hypothetical protein
MAEDPSNTKPDLCSLGEADWVSATELGENITQINHGAWVLAPVTIQQALAGGCGAALELVQDGRKLYVQPPPEFWHPDKRLLVWVNALNPSMQREDYPDRPWPWELRTYLLSSERGGFDATARIFLRRAEAVQWGLESPQAVASEEPPPPREQPGEPTAGSAGGEAAPAPAPAADASVPVANTEAVADEEAAPAPAAAPAPVQSGPEAQPKPDKQSDEPTDPAALTDFIFRELTAMPHAHFKNGCLLQDLIEYLFEAVQLDKDAAGLPRVELFKSIFKGIARAALAGHYALKGHPDDPSGQVRPIPPATLPSFLFNEWNRSRLIVDGPSTIWHGVTVWRSEVEAPDTESDLGEPTPDVASTDPADGRRSSAAPQTEPESPAPKSVPTPTPPITADDWFWKAREAHPRQPREKTGEYARRLEKSMPQSEAGVKKPWDIRTIIRRLQEQRKAEVEAAAQKGRRPTGDR